MLLDWDFYYNLVLGWFYKILYPLSSALGPEMSPIASSWAQGKGGESGGILLAVCVQFSHISSFFSALQWRGWVHFFCLASFFLVAEARIFFFVTVGSSSGTVWLCSSPSTITGSRTPWVPAGRLQESCIPAPHLGRSWAKLQNPPAFSTVRRFNINSYSLFMCLQALCLLNKQVVFTFLQKIPSVSVGEGVQYLPSLEETLISGCFLLNFS